MTAKPYFTIPSLNLLIMNIRNRPNTYLHPLLRSRQHIVIPGRDPESNVCSQIVLVRGCFLGFRVSARN